MKIKHFKIRLNEESVKHDENKLNNFLTTVNVIKIANHVLTSEQGNYWSIIVFYDDVLPIEPDDISRSEKHPAFNPSTLNPEELNRYEALRIWRADTAAKNNFPNYIVASNAQLGEIAKLNPSEKEALNKIKGLGERKVNKYGDEIIAVLNAI